MKPYKGHTMKRALEYLAITACYFLIFGVAFMAWVIT